MKGGIVNKEQMASSLDGRGRMELSRDIAQLRKSGQIVVDRLLKPSEVAKHYGVGIATVWRWMRFGKIRAEQLPGGKGWRIRESELNKEMK
jgi:excisionase family DNA binding protein